MQQPKDPLDKLLKVDQHRVLKKQLGEQKEKLEAMGQESDRKAAKWVKEENKRQEKVEVKAQDDAMTKLSDAKGRTLTYKSHLIEEMKREMAAWEDELPKGYQWLAQYSDKGLVLYYRNPTHEYFARGLKLSGEPKYDLNGVARLIITAMQEMTKQAQPPEPPSGLIVPYK